MKKNILLILTKILVLCVAVAMLAFIGVTGLAIIFSEAEPNYVDIAIEPCSAGGIPVPGVIPWIG